MAVILLRGQEALYNSLAEKSDSMSYNMINLSVIDNILTLNYEVSRLIRFDIISCYMR